MSSTAPLPSTSMFYATASTSTPAAPFPAISKVATSTSTPAAAPSASTSAVTSAVDERQRILPIEVPKCSAKEVTPKKSNGASDDDSGSSSSDDSGGDDDDDDKLDIPPGQSVMDYVASLPGLELRERARVLSKVGIEAKRKEIAGFVGDATAAQMSHLEVKQKFNQLDNWRFTQVRLAGFVTGN